jgi:hypothetical protein
MKIHTQWRQHVEAWCESGLSQADYCASKVSILKPFRRGRSVNYPLTRLPHSK